MAGRQVHMSRTFKLTLLLAAASMLLAGISFAQITKPTFSSKDRELIEAYYDHLVGTLAPGSLDRSPFPLGIEKALVSGSHVPMQLERDLERLPAKLESQLTPLTGDYGRYKLGRHVVLVKKTDLEIQDILKNIAVKDPAK